MIYLICYDIVDDRRRTKLSKLLKTYGLRVQKSVFECKLNEQQFQYLQQKTSSMINLNEDQVRFYPIPAISREKVSIIGFRAEIAVDDPAYIV